MHGHSGGDSLSLLHIKQKPFLSHLKHFSGHLWSNLELFDKKN